MSVGGYRYVLDDVALECWRRLPAEDQEQLLDYFPWLRQNPSHESVVTDFDSSGRRVSVSPAGKYVVIHWTDHAVREVRINEIAGD